MSRAVVVFSGGQDSTTCLYWAKMMFEEVIAVSFDYNQRHKIELKAAEEIAKLADVGWMQFTIDPAIFKSALIGNEGQIKNDGGMFNLPTTFTPGRNTVFLSMAGAFALSHGIDTLVTGVCETDYSGYPDCRNATIRSLEVTMNLAVGVLDKVKIVTPLMWINKAETVLLAKRLPGCWEAIAKTVTCYYGQRPGCGDCPACKLRAKGFHDAGLQDPAYGGRTVLFTDQAG